jgi:MFS transporter, DHA1 family, multidrug resistance protein
MPCVEQTAVTLRSILRDRAIVTQFALSFVVMLGLGLVLPILPLYARSFGVGFAAAGLFISAAGVARLVFDILAGSIIDRVGERLSGAGGAFLLAGCSLAAAMVPNFYLAVALWGIGGAGAAVVTAAQYSYLLKVVPTEARARTLGILYGSFNAGVVAGGVIGGFVADTFGLASPLILYSAIMTVAGLLYLRFIVDPSPREKPELEQDAIEVPYQLGMLGRLGELFRLGGFVTAIVLNFAYVWFVIAVFDTLIPLYGTERLDMSPAGIGLILGVALVTEFVILYPAGLLADKRGRKIVLIPSFAALAVVTALLGLTSSVPSLVIGMGILGIASGFAGVPPAAVLSDVVPDSSSGLGIGAFRFAGDLAAVFGPALIGIAIATFGFSGAFVVAAVPLLIALGFVLRTPETMARDAA